MRHKGKLDEEREGKRKGGEKLNLSQGGRRYEAIETRNFYIFFSNISKTVPCTNNFVYRAGR